MLVKLPAVDFVDDRDGKPVGIQKFIGRRPIAAFGNSDSDLQMLQWTAAGTSPRFRLYAHNTYAEREWAYDRQYHPRIRRQFHDRHALHLDLADRPVSTFGNPSVALLGGVAEIPGALPSMVPPDFSAIPRLLLPALSLAIVGLAVAAGVSQSYPEPDGSIPNASRDFVGQGAANVVGGFFQTMPGGGSFSRTVTSVSASAETRMSNLFLGVILALILLTVGWLAKFFPLAALAGLLIDP